MIDPETLHNLLHGLYTCYWCGSIADKDCIAEHVDKCLEQIHWLHEHVEKAK